MQYYWVQKYNNSIWVTIETISELTQAIERQKILQKQFPKDQFRLQLGGVNNKSWVKRKNSCCGG